MEAVDLKRYTVSEKQKVVLADFPTDPPDKHEKEETVAKTEKLGARMEELFDLLVFAGSNSLLIVLQGMDAAGKDGTIRHILKYSHAQTCRVASFKVPTPEELGHDFLWRCHKQTPGKGEICVFNRSHYEDVGVVRVHEIVPKTVWEPRFAMIRDFESLLAKNNTVVLKFWLNITKDEQKQRLIERENEVEDGWKLAVGDWKEREFWDGYQDAYSDAIGETGAEHAPWIVVPGNKKWFRNLVVTQAIVDALEPLAPQWEAKLKKVGDAAKLELAEYRALLGQQG